MTLTIGDYNLFTIIAMAFALLGSYSLGYLFLRVGWPKIRTLGEDYRAGWGIALGLFFTGLVIICTIVFRAFGLAFGSAPVQFFTMWVLAFFIVIAVLEIKQKLYKGSVPEEENTNPAAPPEKPAEAPPKKKESAPEIPKPEKKETPPETPEPKKEEPTPAAPKPDSKEIADIPYR